MSDTSQMNTIGEQHNKSVELYAKISFPAESNIYKTELYAKIYHFQQK